MDVAALPLTFLIRPLTCPLPLTPSSGCQGAGGRSRVPLCCQHGIQHSGARQPGDPGGSGGPSTSREEQQYNCKWASPACGAKIFKALFCIGTQRGNADIILHSIQALNLSWFPCDMTCHMCSGICPIPSSPAYQRWTEELCHHAPTMTSATTGAAALPARGSSCAGSWQGRG